MKCSIISPCPVIRVGKHHIQVGVQGLCSLRQGQAPTFFKPHIFRRLADRKIGGNWQKYSKVSNHYKYHLINYLTSQYFMMLIEIQRKPSQGVTNHLLSFLPLSLKASLARAGPLAPLWPKGSAFRR